MLGAVIVDTIGSAYEGNPIHSRQFPLFGRRSDYTDDTVLTVATAFAIFNGSDYGDVYRSFGRNRCTQMSARIICQIHLDILFCSS